MPSALPSEARILTELPGVRFPPLRFGEVRADRSLTVLPIRWEGGGAEFLVEAQARATPKALRDGLHRVKRQADRVGRPPLLVVPHLREEQLEELAGAGVSGIDLGGNGVVTLPGRLLVYRTGRPNRYPQGQGIANVYRGASGLVARTFLIRPTFRSAGELHAAVRESGGDVSLSLVSKACAGLAEDLVIEKAGRGRRTELRLLRPAALLDRLRAAFRPPAVTARAWAKWASTPAVCEAGLAAWSQARGVRVRRTGASSVTAHATAAADPVAHLYCENLAAAGRELSGDLFKEFVTDRRPLFPTVALLETADAAAYFDPGPGPGLTASPVQTYLELAGGDSRDAEVAADVRRAILDRAERAAVDPGANP